MSRLIALSAVFVHIFVCFNKVSRFGEAGIKTGCCAIEEESCAEAKISPTKDLYKHTATDHLEEISKDCVVLCF